MKKIPSLFMRNYEGDRLVRDEVVEGSEWVLAGEGMATRKWDGTACMIRAAVLHKRYDCKRGRTPPEGWEPCEVEPDEHTGHWPGWMPIGRSLWGPPAPEHKYHWEAYMRADVYPNGYPDGTYELCGPKVQGNPEGFDSHWLIRHGRATEYGPSDRLEADPRTFEEIRSYLATHDIEGIVWHHQARDPADGNMVKIKARDFGVGRGTK